MSRLAIRKWWHFKYKAKFEKNRSKIGIFNIFFKTLCQNFFEDLEFNGNWKFQTFAPMSHEMASLKVFLKFQKSPLLIANIVKGVLSGLRQFLATESPWKIMKNTFYFILTNWICYWQFRFCSYYAFSLKQISDICEVWKY